MGKISIKAKLLGEHFLKCHKLNPDQLLAVEKINPNSLLNHNRIDLIPKINYATQYIDGDISKTTVESYKAIIMAFSLGAFVEPGQESSKNSFEQYIREFEKLIRQIQKFGYQEHISVVPIGKNRLLLDGSHRVAACIALGRKISVVQIDKEETKYNALFFSKRLVHPSIIDGIVENYTERTKTHRSLLVWPNLVNRHEKKIKLILSKYNESIIHTKPLVLSRKGVCSLVIQAYEKEPWIGTPESMFKGARLKSKNVLNRANTGETTKRQRLLLVVFDDPNSILACAAKKELREIFATENRGCHSTDSTEESRALCGIFFRSSSVKLLNEARFLRYPEFIKNLLLFRHEISRLSDTSLDQFILVGSAILGIHGIRRPNDIDYLTVNKNVDGEVTHGESDSKLPNKYGYTVLQLISESDKNEYLFSVKFVNLHLLSNANKYSSELRKNFDVFLIKMYGHGIQLPGVFLLRVISAGARLARVIKKVAIGTVAQR